MTDMKTLANASNKAPEADHEISRMGGLAESVEAVVGRRLEARRVGGWSYGSWDIAIGGPSWGPV